MVGLEYGVNGLCFLLAGSYFWELVIPALGPSWARGYTLRPANKKGLRGSRPIEVVNGYGFVLLY